MKTKKTNNEIVLMGEDYEGKKHFITFDLNPEVTFGGKCLKEYIGNVAFYVVTNGDQGLEFTSQLMITMKEFKSKLVNKLQL